MGTFESPFRSSTQRAACAPFPFLYIPERFERRNRDLSPAEVETLEWTALASGAKGLRRHFAYNPLPPAPEMAAVLSNTASNVGRLQSILAPLVAVSDETQGDEKAGYIRVLTAWSGSQGALFYVRDRSVRRSRSQCNAQKRRRIEVAAA